MTSAIWKNIVCILIFCCTLDAVYAHLEPEHSKDIGMVFGICDAQGKGFKAKTKELHKNIGGEIAFLIDKEANELYRELNNIIRDELKDEVFFAVLPDTVKSSNQEFLKYLRENRNVLKASNDYQALTVAAEKLNIVSTCMEKSLFYANRNTEKISDAIYSKRNNFYPDSDQREMKAFLLRKNQQLEDIIKKKDFQPQTIKAKLDNLARDEKLFRWGGYMHRIFFHWGYNKNFRTSYQPLQNRMNVSKEFITQLSPDYAKKWHQIEDKLYSRINQRWQDKKKSALYNIKMHLYNISHQHIDDETANIITQIAYNVHILGDYSGTIIRPLAPVQDIRNELIECVKKIPVNSKNKSKPIIDRLNKASQKYGNDDAKNAEALLDVLKNDLPRLIKSSKTSFRVQLLGE